MKNRFGLRKKILLAFILLILTFVFNAIVTVVIINKNRTYNEIITRSLDPSLNILRDFNDMVLRSRMLSTNWVYLQNNINDKNALKELHLIEYKTLTQKLHKLLKEWDESDAKNRVKNILEDTEVLLRFESKIMRQLAYFEDYQNPIKKFEVQMLVESQIIPLSNGILTNIEFIAQLKKDEKKTYENLLNENTDNLRFATLGLTIILLAIGIIIALFMSNAITQPINHVKNFINQLSLGEPVVVDIKETNDEIGEMISSVKRLSKSLKSVSTFADHIGNGKLDEEFNPLSENDLLGHSLLNMRNNLKNVNIEEHQRSWSNNGLAKFVDILRDNNDNLSLLCTDIISTLVRYLNAAHGGIYLVSDKKNETNNLQLTASFGFDKEKLQHTTIRIGDGMLGQAAKEKEIVNLKNLPDDFFKITSGMGESNPRNLIIIPLTLNGELYGIIEIGSFYEIEAYQLEFIEKLSLSIASTLANVKINERTKILLEESQFITQQLHEQEEEMRQNMEEMQASAEEVKRREQELIEENVRLKNQLKK